MNLSHDVIVIDQDDVNLSRHSAVAVEVHAQLALVPVSQFSAAVARHETNYGVVYAI